MRSTIGPRPELLDELEDDELLDDELELLEDELEEELELLELELLDELELLEDVVPELDPVPPQAVSAAASRIAGTTFILWYFPYTFIFDPLWFG